MKQDAAMTCGVNSSIRTLWVDKVVFPLARIVEQPEASLIESDQLPTQQSPEYAKTKLKVTPSAA